MLIESLLVALLSNIYWVIPISSHYNGDIISITSRGGCVNMSQPLRTCLVHGNHSKQEALTESGSEETTTTQMHGLGRRLMAVCTDLTPVGVGEEAEKHRPGQTDIGELNDLLHLLSTIWLNYWEIPHALFCWDRCVERKGGRLSIFFSSGLWVSSIFLEGKGFSLTLLLWVESCFQGRLLGGSQAGGWEQRESRGSETVISNLSQVLSLSFPKLPPICSFLSAPLPSPCPNPSCHLFWKQIPDFTLKLHSCFLQVSSQLSQRVTILQHKVHPCPFISSKTLQLLPIARGQTAKILRLWRQSTCPSTRGWIKDMW